ncbi:MAG: endonuclease III domain-containing protein [Candidatus Omnitrophota bacterium]
MAKDIIIEVYNRLHKRFGPMNWWPAESDFEVMVGAILTQNTAWTNVEKAISNLKKKKMLTPARLKKISVLGLANIIRPAGYFNIKAKRLKSGVAFLFEEYKGQLSLARGEETEITRAKLLNVYGIGPETCDSILLYALNKPVFVVDAYTKRIFSRIGLADENSSYENLQSLFMRNLPRRAKLYNEYHALIVQLGKEICSNKPKCDLCPLSSLCERRGFPAS